MQIAKRKVVTGLLAKGFREDERRGNPDHVYLRYYTLEGHESEVFTKVSHGTQEDLDDFLLGRMAMQCHLRKREFAALVQCLLSQERYEAHLRGQGHIKSS